MYFSVEKLQKTILKNPNTYKKQVKKLNGLEYKQSSKFHWSLILKKTLKKTKFGKPRGNNPLYKSSIFLSFST